MCTRFVYRGDNIITGFNFDIDIVEWNHKVINTKDCFYIGIMRPDGMRHSYHGVNRNGNVGTLLYVHGNLSGTYQDRSMKNYRIKDNLSVYKWLLDSLFKKRCKN